MDPQPTAPPVVAVVVTHDAGPWLEEALACLGAQDYPDLSVLVIDAASSEDPTTRVAAALPNAFIRRLPENTGFSAAADQVLEMVEGAAFLCFCHDDVALEPDALRQLVEEALRSNAGIVGPKLVSWDEPRQLLQVGITADRSGTPVPLVERGELDQEQHDGVRDVFAIPGGCMLVRADLFAELGGYDREIGLHGEDIDLCWRAQVVGARVVVAPAARVRHLEALARRQDPDLRRRLQQRHRLRTVLKCDRPLTLAWVLPAAALAGLAEILYALLAGRRSQARDVAAAWWWNLRGGHGLRQARRATQRHRRVPDADILRLQAPGSARMRSFLRGQLTGEDRAQSLASTGRQLVGSMRRGTGRTVALVWLVLAVIVVVGSRDLLTGRLPIVGELAPYPAHATDLLRRLATGWRFSGLGADAPAPTAFGLLGLGGILLAGATGLLQKILVLGCLPLGIAGAWRVTRPIGSTRARLVAVVTYAAIPLPYNALAEGRWSGLIAYGLLPFILGRLFAATRDEPFGGDGRPLWRQVAPLGLLLALGGAFVPALLPLAVLVGVALTAGSLLVGGAGQMARVIGVAALAALTAVVLLFPWVLNFVPPGSDWATFAGVARPAARGLGLGALLRFQTGPLGAGPLGWAFLVAAALPLLIGRDWRLAWAARLWLLALACVGLAWAGQRAAFGGHATPTVEVLLAPAALALALSAALGMVAFEVDLRTHRFGWRQGASVLAAAAVVVGVLPVAAAARTGRWGLPSLDVGATLGWMADERKAGDFRVLWLGDPEVLPLPGWQDDVGLAYGLSRGGPPTVEQLWPAPADGATKLVPDALHVATRAGTARLGHLLAPMAIRYVVVVERAGTDGWDRRRPAPSSLRETLAAQVDLRRVQADQAVTVYQNTAWGPGRARLPRDFDTGRSLTADLSSLAPALRDEQGPARWRGPVRDGEGVLLSEAASDRWHLSVDGKAAARDSAFGWANKFTAPSGGEAALTYRTPISYRLLLLIQLLLWFAVIRVSARYRRRAPLREAPLL